MKLNIKMLQQIYAFFTKHFQFSIFSFLKWFLFIHGVTNTFVEHKSEIYEFETEVKKLFLYSKHRR